MATFEPGEKVGFKNQTAIVTEFDGDRYTIRTDTGDVIRLVPTFMLSKMVQNSDQQSPSDIDRLVAAIDNVAKKLDDLIALKRAMR